MCFVLARKAPVFTRQLSHVPWNHHGVNTTVDEILRNGQGRSLLILTIVDDGVGVA